MARGEEVALEHHRQRMTALQQKVHRKIDFHLNKPYVEITEFYSLVREFFLELLAKDYEPTYEEILEELENIEHDYLAFPKEQRKKAQNLLSELSALEYGGRPVTQEDVKRVLSDFKSLASEFTAFEDETIEHALQQGMVALQKGNSSKGKEAYMRAHSLFQKLAPDARERYAPQLQELYKRVSH